MRLDTACGLFISDSVVTGWGPFFCYGLELIITFDLIVGYGLATHLVLLGVYLFLCVYLLLFTDVRLASKTTKGAGKVRLVIVEGDT